MTDNYRGLSRIAAQIAPDAEMIAARFRRDATTQQLIDNYRILPMASVADELWQRGVDLTAHGLAAPTTAPVPDDDTEPTGPLGDVVYTVTTDGFGTVILWDGAGREMARRDAPDNDSDDAIAAVVCDMIADSTDN